MTLKPTPKAAEITKLLETSFKRSTSIESLRCVPKPIGCGRQIDPGEIEVWTQLDIEEYRISGLCKTCQDKVFVEPEEERSMMDNLCDMYKLSEETEPRYIFGGQPPARGPEEWDWD